MLWFQFKAGQGIFISSVWRIVVTVRCFLGLRLISLAFSCRVLFKVRCFLGLRMISLGCRCCGFSLRLAMASSFHQFGVFWLE